MVDRLTRSVMPALLGPADPRRDRIGIAVIAAATLLFTIIASVVLARAMTGSFVSDQLMVIALLLNVALLLFGWRRHSALRAALNSEASAARAGLLGNTDSLTGLGNRRALAEKGSTMLAHAQRRGKAVALVRLDIDDLRDVTDRHGPTLADALLVQVAAAIKEVLPAGCAVARIEGESFAAVTPFEPAFAETVDRLAERLLARFGEPFMVGGVRVVLASSIGLARSDQGGTSVDALLRSAALAQSAARAAGGNRHCWFDQGMVRALEERAALEARLRTALGQGVVVPWFDAQVALDGGSIAGFEVLARWETPQGVLLADAFMPVAEEAGLAGTLSEAVLRHACAQARDWDPALRLSVNLSPSQLRDPWAAQKLLRVLAECGFPAGRLDVELTEAGILNNLATAQAIAASLKAQGVRLILDDFGTGYASIGHLRALAFDAIKIDRSFVAGMATSADSAAVVTAITRLADSLNLPVIAEGVEDDATRERLLSLGCVAAQGHHFFGGPISAAAARRLLAERRLIAAAA